MPAAGDDGGALRPDACSRSCRRCLDAAIVRLVEVLPCNPRRDGRGEVSARTRSWLTTWAGEIAGRCTRGAAALRGSCSASAFLQLLWPAFSAWTIAASRVRHELRRRPATSLIDAERRAPRCSPARWCGKHVRPRRARAGPSGPPHVACLVRCRQPTLGAVSLLVTATATVRTSSRRGELLRRQLRSSADGARARLRASASRDATDDEIKRWFRGARCT